jgi:phenylpropionate dioxygenase-like ring-hydroxylating dioxygenase large terminal subunit
MKVTRRTPRSQLTGGVILLKGEELAEGLIEEVGLDQSYIQLAWNRFTKLSTRVIFADGEIDFDLARGNDTLQQLHDKFMAYLNSECLEMIEAAQNELTEMDKPYDEALAPEEPPEDADPK